MHPRPVSSPRRPSAFTLVELLITIGIIAVLISILLPAVSMVKMKAKIVSTKAMINRLETAIGAYSQDYNGAYPGPFANSELRPYVTNYNFLNPPAINNTTPLSYHDSSGGTTPIPSVTSSENLYLGLSAGLKWTRDPATGLFTDIFFDEKSAQASDGPNSLNNMKPKRSDAYLKIDPSETTYRNRCPLEASDEATYPWGKWTNTPGAAAFAGDSRIPEYVDKFSSPMPVLFVRAQRGATGVNVVNNASQTKFLAASTTSLPDTFDPQFQYDPKLIQKCYPNHIGWVDSVSNAIVSPLPYRPWPDRTNSPTEDASAPSPNGQPYYKAFKPTAVLVTPDEVYFGNAASSTASHKEPAKKDQYLLISAGPDGRYGTEDDITNFRD